MSSDILVIGGTSKIGRGLVRRLTADGHPVRALARSQASQAALAGLGAQPVPGDLADPGSLAAAMEGARWTATVTDAVRALTGGPARSLEAVLRSAHPGLAA